MKHVKAMTGAALAFLLAVGCGAADDGGASEGFAPLDPSAQQTAASEGAELARIEFADGNVVKFAELSGGVLVSEIGSELNPRHLSAKEGMSALEAFRALAPGRAVPEPLMRAHERMYPAQGTVPSASEGGGLTPMTEESPMDPDLEHGGEFQQSFPASNFLSRYCDFPTTSAYKHTNRTDAHTDTSMDVKNAYYAVASDIGTITAQACAGKNAGGYFKGNCSSRVPIPAGYVSTNYYDAGIACPDDPNWLCEIFGCPRICEPRKVRLELNYAKVSSSVRFHECAKLGR